MSCLGAGGGAVDWLVVVNTTLVVGTGVVTKVCGVDVVVDTVVVRCPSTWACCCGDKDEVGAVDLLTVIVLTVGVPLTVTVETITVIGMPSMGGRSPPCWSLVGTGFPPLSTVLVGSWLPEAAS